MRAVAIERPGGPDVLQEVERPRPNPGTGEVLIRVQAAGVNRPDVLQRKGAYAPPPGVSDLPGLEIAGIVEGGDLDGSGWRRGDRVCALVAGGGYAQWCVAPVGQCLPVPRGLSFAEAAALPETYFTVWSNVFDRARLAPGESLLVQGGTSGIGVTAIQLAAALGHAVFGTAGSDDKARACEALGARRGINYRTEDFVTVVKEETAGRGVDVILDMVAGDYVPRELSCLADDGRLVIIALQGGAQASLDLAAVLRRRLTITGSTLRPRSVAFKATIAERLRSVVWPLIEAGRIKPIVHSTFPLARAADAHRLMESSEHIGKIVLTVGPEAADRGQ
jgi:NADPH2:quinone reductase